MARMIDPSELEGDDLDQADRQAQVARDQRIEWHIAEPGAFRFFRDATVADRPPIVLQRTPAQ